MSDPIPPKNKPDAWFYRSYKDWNIFVQAEDYTQGKIKNTIFASNQQTDEIKEIDISPYGYPDLTLIIRVIDAGFPSRLGPSPLNHADLAKIEAYGKAAE